MGLIARAIEAEGIPTLSVTSARDITRAVWPPRAAYLDYPLGHTSGRPHEPELNLADTSGRIRCLREPACAGVDGAPALPVVGVRPLEGQGVRALRRRLLILSESAVPTGGESAATATYDDDRIAASPDAPVPNRARTQQPPAPATTAKSASSARASTIERTNRPGCAARGRIVSGLMSGARLTQAGQIRAGNARE